MISREAQFASIYDAKHGGNNINYFAILEKREEKKIKDLFLGTTKRCRFLVVEMNKIFDKNIEESPHFSPFSHKEEIEKSRIIVDIPEEYRIDPELPKAIDIFCKMKELFWKCVCKDFKIKCKRTFV